VKAANSAAASTFVVVLFMVSPEVSYGLGWPAASATRAARRMFDIA
jgi:hypothetical protein